MVDDERGTRVAVVTGGGRGIGRGIVLSLADLGFAVVVNYRSDRESAEATCRGSGSPRLAAGGCSFAPMSRTWPKVASCWTRRSSVTDGLDLWVNNAGIAPERRLDLLETTPESWDRVVATNLRGPFFLSPRRWRKR